MTKHAQKRRKAMKNNTKLMQKKIKNAYHAVGMSDLRYIKLKCSYMFLSVKTIACQ